MGVASAPDRDALDGGGYVVDRDGEEPFRHLFGRLHRPGAGGDVFGQSREGAPDFGGVERFVTRGAEHGRERFRPHPPQKHVRVGDREGAAAAIAGRPRHRAGGLGADAEAGAVESQDRSAPRRHGVQGDHGDAQTDAAQLGPVGAGYAAVQEAHVGGRAAHVEPQHTPIPGARADAGRADGARGGTGEHAVPSAEPLAGDEAAVRLHAADGRAGAEAGGHPVQVGFERRREIGVDDGDVGAGHQPLKRTGFVGGRYLGEAFLPRDGGEASFVRGIPPAVNEGDGGGDAARRAGGPEIAAGGGFVQWDEYLSDCGNAFAGFDDALGQGRGANDFKREQAWPFLRADGQQVGEARGHYERSAGALAFEERVGADGGAEGHRLDRRRGEIDGRVQSEDRPNSGKGWVFAGAGGLCEQLGAAERSPRRPRDHVDEGAAAIDPDLPAVAGHAW